MIGVFVAWRPNSLSSSDVKLVDEAGSACFVGRKKELSILLESWRHDSCNVFILTGPGGMGKTSLMQKWLARAEVSGWLGAEQVFGWSFPEVSRYPDAQQAMQDFLQQALEWFGADMKIPATLIEQLNLLARLIQRRRTLLVLDNVSQLNFALDVSEGLYERQLLSSLLNQLAAYNPGLCIVISRKEIPVGRIFSSDVIQYELPNLGDESGGQLLNRQGVKAETERLQRIAHSFGGEPLSLNLLGGYLAYAYKGSPERLNSIPIWQDMQKEGFHARRVLSAIERWMGTAPDLLLLYLLSLMDGPVTKKELFVLLNNCRQSWFRRWLKPDEALRVIAPLTRVDVREYTKIQRRLYRLHLISSPAVASSLDMHQLIRDYFRQQAMARFPSIRERFDALLQNCRQPVEQVRVQETDRGLRSHALPDVQTSVRSTRELGLKLEQSASRKQWYRASILAYHLSEHHLVLGNIPASIYCARRSVAYAELSHDQPSMLQNLKMLTKLLSLTGRKAEALTLLQGARRSFDSARIPSKVTV